MLLAVGESFIPAGFGGIEIDAGKLAAATPFMLMLLTLARCMRMTSRNGSRLITRQGKRLRA